MTAEMDVSTFIDGMIAKADTIAAVTAAIGSTWYAAKTKQTNARLLSAQAKGAEFDTLEREFNLLRSLGSDLKADIGSLRKDLHDCEQSKRELTERVDAQDRKLMDLAQNLAASMEARGLPDGMKIKVKKDTL
jgi:predicted  nucleic acid-binding Zn-ribbon protein